MQQQMESRDEETLELKETYSSLQQEVDIKTKKLKKVMADLKHFFYSWTDQTCYVVLKQISIT